MEYVQLTLDDWVQMKQKIKMELQGIKQSFVRIGYHLRQIEDQRLYERDGYRTISEFAEMEYGLKATTVSRFMAINRAYSVDGYSETLRPEFAELGRSQLEEMLSLPEEDRMMIRPETSRQDIRDLKRFEREQPQEGSIDELEEVFRSFFLDYPDIRKELKENKEAGTREKIEIVNPGGNRSYRKGMFYLMMYENKIMLKKIGNKPQELSWEQFFEQTETILEEIAEPDERQEETLPEEQTEQDRTPKEEKIEQKEETEPVKEKNEPQKEREKSPQLQEKPFAPAQEKEPTRTEKHSSERDLEEVNEEQTEKGPELQVEGQMCLPNDYPGTEPEDLLIDRKEYLDTLTAWGTAEYLVRTMHPDLLKDTDALYQWLLEKV